MFISFRNVFGKHTQVLKTIYDKKRCIAIVIVLIMLFCNQQEEMMCYAKEDLVVVIDPGHGGDNLGTNYLPVPEKYYTMEVAKHMKQYLEEFENITVYMTHEEDVDMSLQERAEYAQSVNADFLFSLHFNMSLSHKLYGSEVWIPSTGTLYSQGYSIGNEFINQFKEMGLFSRGIKTRIGNSGTDYYGIIRQCAIRNIPAIIVEHCHVDNLNDIENMQSDKLEEFGYRNAQAVAKYYGLISKDSEIDYSEYAPLAISTPSERVFNDTTPPDYVHATLVGHSKNRRYTTVKLTAMDKDTPIQYYAYSYDDGLTWSMFHPWISEDNTMTITVNETFFEKQSILFKTINLYDLQTLSNKLYYVK